MSGARESREEEAYRLLRGMAQERQLAVIARLLDTPRRKDNEIPVTPLREHFLICCLRDGLTAADLARRLEWFYGANTRDNGRRCADGTRVLRRLGLTAVQVSRGHGQYGVTRHVTYNTAVQLARAMDADFHEVGV